MTIGLNLKVLNQLSYPDCQGYHIHMYLLENSYHTCKCIFIFYHLILIHYIEKDKIFES